MLIYKRDYILTKTVPTPLDLYMNIVLVKMKECWVRSDKMPDSYWPPTEGIPKSPIRAMPCRLFGISVKVIYSHAYVWL